MSLDKLSVLGKCWSSMVIWWGGGRWGAQIQGARVGAARLRLGLGAGWEQTCNYLYFYYYFIITIYIFSPIFITILILFFAIYDHFYYFYHYFSFFYSFIILYFYFHSAERWGKETSKDVKLKTSKIQKFQKSWKLFDVYCQFITFSKYLSKSNNITIQQQQHPRLSKTRH